MARVKVNQIKEDKFKDWQFDSLSMRDACERGSITIEEYIEFNELYFPNRKPKDKITLLYELSVHTRGFSSL